jgi:hypothetical protein
MAVGLAARQVRSVARTCLFGLVLSTPFMWLLKPGDRLGFAMTIEGSVSEKIGEIEHIKARLEFIRERWRRIETFAAQLCGSDKEIRQKLQGPR